MMTAAFCELADRTYKNDWKSVLALPPLGFHYLILAFSNAVGGKFSKSRELDRLAPREMQLPGSRVAGG